ncbi:hypothetical protein CABS01_03299 [Colletotrichum abscissum]|uniref:uncharacterized protein n=1 Tax=Colletotrichum abscissum TaxID=1671311 RepID=UPI0027D54DB8|nr:uncharacterized protein CABS01_03299 [Colletotrichum abscissum]KAK1477997.1 hypothetical protein CABS01_03299 [Colletotrichum abscissum]
MKKRFYYSDPGMAILSFIYLALGILVVSHESISWYLGVGNNQLIVVGFLLSITSLCLGSVAPILFILIEARFGKSTIQNYDGLLRNKPTASRLGMSWRVALILMLALPIALSVAYKTFTGGESQMEIDSFDYISNKTYYGMFQPPGILSFNGVSGFLNAATAFREATKLSSNGSEPPFPTLPSTYGYNILLLNVTSAAALDTIQAFYVIAIQERLAIGESWTITAPVTGTVATFNKMIDSDRQTFESDFVSHFLNRNAWGFDTKDMFNGWSLTLTNRKSDSDQSIQYIGLESTNPECIQSRWMQPCMATSVAAMLWSRNAVMKGSGAFNSEEFDVSSMPWELKNETKVPYKDVRVKYRVHQAEQIIFYNRPTLRESPGLYLVLAIQPFLIVIILGLSSMRHSEPLGKGFGLVSTFSGIDSQSLSSLAGASLPGELSRPLKLTMSHVQTGGTNTIHCRAGTSSEGRKRNGKLSRNVVDH